MDPWKKEMTLEYLQSFPIYRFRKKFLLKNIPVTKGMKILEAGSGPAHDSIILAEKGAVVTGVDLSKNAIRNAKMIYPKVGYAINLIRADIMNLPFKENCFDLTWNAGVLEHFNDCDLERIFKEMVRVTAGSLVGKVLVIVPNRFYFWYQIGLRLTRKRQYEFEKAYSVSKLKGLFNRHNLKEINVSGIHVHPAPSYIMPRTGWLTTLLERVSRFLEDSTEFGMLKSILGLDICVWGKKK